MIIDIMLLKCYHRIVDDNWPYVIKVISQQSITVRINMWHGLFIPSSSNYIKLYKYNFMIPDTGQWMYCLLTNNAMSDTAVRSMKWPTTYNRPVRSLGYQGAPRCVASVTPVPRGGCHFEARPLFPLLGWCFVAFTWEVRILWDHNHVFQL